MTISSLLIRVLTSIVFLENLDLQLPNQQALLSIRRYHLSLPLLAAKPGDKMCNIKYHQRLTGSLNHLAGFTRPDISFAVSKLSQFNSNPTTSHLKAAMHVLRYLKSTRNLCIVYKRQPGTVIIVGYSDADWGSNENDRLQFVNGYVGLSVLLPAAYPLKNLLMIVRVNSACPLIGQGDCVSVVRELW